MIQFSLPSPSGRLSGGKPGRNAGEENEDEIVTITVEDIIQEESLLN